ncbi:morphogenetic protein [Pantoea sp. B623]|uniref:morphogenetic protein n=1 Tax=Pantoea sp. B623 TaxID=2974561 RepID=UPI00216A0521|nr:morphogenetic protein [Pantoea sp. B623]MCS4496240.1 morphogenetic protein [Pantoea sp. B623]
MKECPILLNAEMVRAVLDGGKTQTRRILKVQPHAGVRNSVFVKSGYEDGHGKELVCPFGAVGDRLWVRETWARYNIDQDTHDIAYRATTPDDWPKEGRWRPSIHMPRWASRITLEITGVRVERLQDITNQDAMAEGIGHLYAYDESQPTPKDATRRFAELWQSIYGADSWQANPWVWVIEFKRVEVE